MRTEKQIEDNWEAVADGSKLDDYMRGYLAALNWVLEKPISEEEALRLLNIKLGESSKVRFYRRMIQELKQMAHGQKTNSISYVIGMLEHDFPELKEEVE